MQSIETLAIETYQNNLNYFKEHHSKLLKILNVLDKAIENGDFTPKYDLEYLDGYFDVKELQSGNYLYSGDSKHISEQFSNIINFQKNKYTFEGLPVYRSTKLQKTDKDRTEMMEGILPIMDYYLDYMQEDGIMNSIEKFMFIGVALGLHIPIVDTKINSKEYLIIEDDLELFRLSLFTTDYATLGKKAKLFFAVAEDDNLFLGTMTPFLEDSFYNNRYLKYAHFPTHSKNKLKQIQNAILSQSFISFPYRIELSKCLRPLSYLNEGYKILNLAGHLQNSLFSNKPVLLVTAGPSLQKNIEWLKENHQRFIIIAVSATLKILYKYKITPSIVTHIDGFGTAIKHFEGFPVKVFLQNSVIVLGPFVDSFVKTFFEKEQVYYFEEETEYIEGYKGISAPCVGSFSFLLALTLNARELYLLGLDLAVDSKTGATHSSEHVYNQEKDMSKKDDVSNVMSLRENLFPIKGNFEDIVYTNTLFNFSIQYLHNNIDQIKESIQTVYNLNDGAHFYNTTPKNIAEVDISMYATLDKKNIFQEIQKVFANYSVSKLNAEDMLSLKKRLEYSLGIQEKIKKYSKSVSKTNAEAYIFDLLGIVSEILNTKNRETNNIIQVYYSYFKNILPIVFDFFNTQGLKNKKQHIKRLNVMIVKEMQELEGSYSRALKDFLSGKHQDDVKKEHNFMLSFYDSIDENKIKDVCKEQSIGFLAVEENLNDKEFIHYIKELCIRFPKATFKAFYFSEQEKKELEIQLGEYLHRCEFLIPTDIYSISSNVRIFLTAQELSTKKVFSTIISQCSNVFSMIYTKEDKRIKLNEVDFSAQMQILKNHIVEFDIDNKIINNSYINIVLHKLLENTNILFEDISIKQTLYEYTYFTTLEYALISDEYIANYFDFVNKMIKFIKIKNNWK